MGHSGRAARTRRRRGRALTTTTARVAAAVLFLSFVDVFALLPTVAPHASSLGAGPAMLGLIVGAYSAANLPANVAGGVLVDRLGRRRMTLLGLALAVLAVALYPLAATPGQLLAARLLHGGAGGLLVPAVFALAGDRAETGRTGRTMGRLGALIGAAAVVAPAGAGILRQLAGTSAVFGVVAGLLGLGWLMAWRWVGDAPSPAPPASAGLPGLLRLTALRRALAATAAMTVAVGVLAAFLPARAEELGAEPWFVGALFTIYALAAAAVMLSPVSSRVDRGLGGRLIATGLGTLAVALLIVVLATGPGAMVAAMVVFGLGYGLIFPAATGTASLLSGPLARGRAFGLFNAAFSVGLAVGPPAAGLIAERVPALDPFVLAAGLCGLATLVLAATANASGPHGHTTSSGR